MFLWVYARLLGPAMTAARQPRGEGKPETEGTETAVGEGNRSTRRIGTRTGAYELPSEAHIYQRRQPVTSETTVVESCDRDRETR